jgi:DNA polymerase I-like protein with 3'-5' exonuclease and polymerase domains
VAWLEVADAVVVYMDMNMTVGMVHGVVKASALNKPIKLRWLDGRSEGRSRGVEDRVRAIKTHELSMLNMPLSATEQHWLYNSLDCCLTHEIYSVIEPQLDEVTRATYEFSKDLQGPVLEMRLRGILVDQQRRAEVIAEYEKQINFLSANFTRILSEGLGLDGFNWRSPAQLKDLLYVKLGLAPD